MRVKDGTVRKKNNHRPTTTLGFIIDRQSPSKGYKHVVTKNDLRTFLDLIPDWPELSVGLERIVLGRGEPSEGWNGLYRHFHREQTGAIYVSAWSGELWKKWDKSYFEEHSPILTAVKVRAEPVGELVRCYFTTAQAKAFMLLHIFMHELGHHHDRMRFKQKDRTRGGEPYAEEFANDRLSGMLPGYIAAFGDPSSE